MACEILSEFVDQLSKLDPEKYYVSYDNGEVGIMLSTFLNSVEAVRRIACGEDRDCRRLEQFINFLWMLRWRGGYVKIYPLGIPPTRQLSGEEARNVFYLCTAPRPIHALQLDVAKLATELYEIYRRLCRPKPGMKQLIAEIVGDEVVEEIDSNVRRSGKRGRKRRRREEESVKETEEVVESTEEVVNQEVYELVAK